MRARLIDTWQRATARMGARDLTRAAAHVAGHVAAPRGPDAGWMPALGAIAGPRWLLSLGKVAGPLAEGAAGVPGAGFARVLVAGPTPALSGPPGAETYAGEHPLPGPGSFAAGRVLLETARDAQAIGARVGVLVSGGASALCEAPAAGLTGADLEAVHRVLVASGASITEMNLVRRHLSALKGGGLARALGPALAFVRVLADVPSGRAEEVGSGPALPQPDRFDQALAVLRRRRLVEGLPPRVVRRLEEGAARRAPASARRAPAVDVAVLAGPADVAVLAGPADLARAAAEAARDVGLGPVTMREVVDGVPASALAAEVVRFLSQGTGLWVAAGEVSVTVPEDAPPGGRARHLALEVLARALAAGLDGWAFLAAGSDGRDGVGAAGAVVDAGLARMCEPAEAQDALRRFAAGSFLEACGAALLESAPVTNLTDLYLAWRVG